MVSPWVTICVIAFGIVVAIGGVMAYLRMYKNSSWPTSRPPVQDSKPAASEHPADQLAAGTELTDNDK